MGMGKTIETLACIAGNPPTSEDRKNGITNTLVVVPGNAVSQWVNEVLKHYNKAMVVTHYKSSNKLNLEMLKQFSIWIASYEEINGQYPSEKAIRKDAGDENLTKNECDKLRPKYLGEIFTMKFFRVVLDEAHSINNYATKSPSLSSLPTPTVFLGHAPYELPKGHILEPIRVQLCREETIIYRLIEDMFRNVIMRNYQTAEAKPRQSWLNYELRLRQAVSHPFLLENVLKGLDMEDIEWLMKRLATVRKPGSFMKQVGRWCEEQFKIINPEDQNSENGIGEDNDPYAEFDMTPQLDLIKRNRTAADDDHFCFRCGCPPDDPYIPPCNHAFCRECIRTYIVSETRLGTEYIRCPLTRCRTIILDIEQFLDLPRPTNSQVPSRKAPSLSSPLKTLRGCGDDLKGIQPKSSPKQGTSTFLATADRNTSHPMTPSAKIAMARSMVVQWCSKYPTDKIIIYTQFVILGRIIGRVLQEEDIGFLYHFGSMTQHQKDEAKSEFKTNPNAKVMVASLKCSNVALNLECANRVILLDLYWNHTTEQQAFGRVFRMGQKKETYFARIMAENTIDERLYKLQCEKMEMIGKTILDFDPSTITLTDEDIIGLFGRVVKDKKGNIIRLDPYYTSDDDGDSSSDSEAEPGDSDSADDVGSISISSDNGANYGDSDSADDE
ncbi:P-loop containing nucleoside triphosphate hydrolase protein [Lasiosphaeria ovina]|uniref:P-loop containing nucleoside triphosphate hydrolase protein n=1 Tax=Lasiosphaeria ovina TaxID=92902 RepID=A0AAE0N853_9PEZI|nr:P-loop containing nucleoside triphosphate hydrolase protein [Lasiosphaeria ovina]